MANFNYRQEKPPSAAVLAARARRLARAGKAVAETVWFIKEVSDKVNITMRNRVRIATEYVKSKIIVNISRPVTKTYVTKTANKILAKALRSSASQMKHDIRSLNTELNDLINSGARHRAISSKAAEINEMESERKSTLAQAKEAMKSSSYVRISNRSKPGEYPKADTTQLMKTIFSDIRDLGPGQFAGYVGTPLDYGLILELRMQRQFLSRTLKEESGPVVQILTGPIK